MKTKKPDQRYKIKLNPGNQFYDSGQLSTPINFLAPERPKIKGMRKLNPGNQPCLHNISLQSGKFSIFGLVECGL
jgi:hypothetical protein